jgi:hypothetical protein
MFVSDLSSEWAALRNVLSSVLANFLEGLNHRHIPGD